MHVFMIGIRPGFSHRYLASDLVKGCLNLARDAGYLGAFGESTSYLAVRNAKRNGFKQEGEVFYDEYEYEGKKVFEELGHTSCRLMVQYLQESES